MSIPNSSEALPDVSVIIPTFKREKEVVESIKSVLSQQGIRTEIIVADDSPEGTAREPIEAIGDATIQYEHRSAPTGGKPAIVRNESAKKAKGRYLYFLDDDDKVAAGALDAMVKALDSRPDRGVVVGWVVPFGDDPVWLKDKRDYFEAAAKVAAQTPSSLWTVAHILFKGPFYVNSACMIRRSLFESLGGYDPSIPIYEDVDFYMRAIRRYGHIYLNRPILHYRTGKPSLMYNLGIVNTATEESYVIIHEKYKKEHGIVEYRFLQACTKLLPFALTRKIPIGS